MISGSYSGGVTFFKGLGGDKYAAGKKLTGKGGKALFENYAPSPCMADWDGDGDWDMALGFIDGPVRLFKNNGDMTFTDAGAFKVGGATLEANDGGPCTTDWDGDGALDLLLGDSDGNVRFYRGQGKGSTDLLVDENKLVLPKADGKWVPRKRDANSPLGFSPATPGFRTKPFAADWNGDGKMDLLVGDYLSLERESKPLSDANRAELERLEKRMESFADRFMEASKPLQAKASKQTGVKDPGKASKAASERWMKAYRALMGKDSVIQNLQKEAEATYKRVAELRPDQSDNAGFVWVYLRK